MKLKHLMLPLLFILSILNASGSNPLHFWHAEKFNRNFTDKWAMALEQDFRSEKNLYYVHADIGIKYKVNPHLSLSLNFREVFEQKNPWVSEHRPHATVATKFKAGGLAVSARSRIEYRIKTDKEVFRNRDMVTIKLRKSFSPLKLVPYIADEIFYDFEHKELNRNRAYVGITIKSIPYLNPTIYLMQQSDYKNEQWNSILILGFKFNF